MFSCYYVFFSSFLTASDCISSSIFSSPPSTSGLPFRYLLSINISYHNSSSSVILLLSNFSTLKLLSDTLSPSQFHRKSIYWFDNSKLINLLTSSLIKLSALSTTIKLSLHCLIASKKLSDL